MAARSAGILLYRFCGERLQVLLAHPGGPFWRRRDEGAWTIPKGEIAADEDAEAAARREFLEETGTAVSGPLLALGLLRQRGGKLVEAFAAEGDIDPAVRPQQLLLDRMAAAQRPHRPFRKSIASRGFRSTRPGERYCRPRLRSLTCSCSGSATPGAGVEGCDGRSERPIDVGQCSGRAAGAAFHFAWNPWQRQRLLEDGNDRRRGPGGSRPEEARPRLEFAPWRASSKGLHGATTDGASEP